MASAIRCPGPGLVFAKFEIEEIDVTYSVGNAPGARGKRGEVLISG